MHVSTGAVASLCEISILVLYATLPGTLYYIALILVSPKLLLNALLASLNAREDLRGQLGGQMLSIPLSRLRNDNASSTGDINIRQQYRIASAPSSLYVKQDLSAAVALASKA
ncbi:hypothetical protein EW026_g4432 [Hermanssonia centrifuga]|uniref:DUF6534 domain-containing protein n=1 Tax=Hermanssonia centrifuga TaxID=98765 RepID=A0A4S4KLP4_9APHY|nr:hypothetical protein EW026_g4432 [Hermanssonia centrifuga]